MGKHKEKLERLQALLRQMGSAVIAFSGGTDSALLLKVAGDVLGERAMGVTGRSATVPKRDLERVGSFVERYNLSHCYVDTCEFDNRQFLSNSKDRCYYCKKQLLTQLKEIAEKNGYSWVCDGSNADDLRDYRPGGKAVREMQVRSPLQEAELTKKEIREISREMGLPTWSLPASACLASRVPYGIPLSKETLKKIDRCEDSLRDMGIVQVRVRHHNEIARIEVLPEEFNKVISQHRDVADRCKKEGYLYVTLDLEGYRMGSLNEMLDKNISSFEENAPSPEKKKPRESKPPKFKPKQFGEDVAVLYTDGGCRGNPGPGAWAFVLFDDQGKEIARGSGRLENATNNVAEYHALIQGLSLALEKGKRKIQVLSDSELMVRQINGVYRVKNSGLMQLALEAQRTRREFQQFAISHIRREENKLADWIVGKTLKEDRESSKKE